jgi:phosphatidylglycerol---prolipoprotein diacylglyceryl transferase
VPRLDSRAVPDQLASIGWPVLDRFRLGDAFAISPHGIGIAVGFLTGAWLFGRIGPRRGLSTDHINTMVLWALVGAVIGSRLFYVIAHVSEFQSPVEWFEVWRGGISLLGGIAGAVLINVRRMRRFGHSFFQVMDPAVIGLALGIAIGRIGDLIIGDHLGKPTSWLFAWTYEGGTLAPPFACAREVCQASLQGDHLEVITRTGAKLFDAGGAVIATGAGVHQTALYDMAGAWALFAFLWWLHRSPRRAGILTLSFGLWYGCMRLIEDSLRIDKRLGPFTGSQWTALTVATISAVTLAVWAIGSRRGGSSSGADGNDADNATAKTGTDAPSG